MEHYPIRREETLVVDQGRRPQGAVAEGGPLAGNNWSYQATKRMLLPAKSLYVHVHIKKSGASFDIIVSVGHPSHF